MKVLSLFDGMSCGRLALERAGIPVEKYYASEIDKYAQIVSEANYPDIVRLGDITAWHFWNIEQPDLIIAGSPCQGFSFAGKQLNFEDPRSKLFFTFVEILKFYKPKNFLLENVKMKKEYQDVISNMLGVEPVEINSALLSAQNRRRLYWCNWKIEQPEDKGILLKDILDDGITADRDKSHSIIASIGRTTKREYFKKRQGQMVLVNVNPSGHGMNGNVFDIDNEKSPTLTTNKGEGIKIGSFVCRATVQKNAEHNCNNKSTTITAAMGMGGGNVPMLASENQYKKDKGKYLDTTGRLKWRKLTPLECERLQTVPDNYTNYVSNSQRYKMLGNGWTIDVISHIFEQLTKIGEPV